MSGIQNNAGANFTLNNYFSFAEPLMLFMFVTRQFSVNVSFPCSHIGQEYSLTFSSQSDDVFTIQSNKSMTFTCIEVDAQADYLSTSDSSADGILKENIDISLKGNLLGLSRLLVEIMEPDLTVKFYDVTSRKTEPLDITLPVARNKRHEIWFPVTVLRNIRTVDKIFMYLITVFLILITMGFGCQLDLGIVKECLKKPVAPGIGFGCQYLVMPLLGFAIAKFLPVDIDRSVALGIFVCGTCPGGGISNIYTYLLDGDVSLSITMTFVSTVTSLGMMPLWIYTLGRLFVDDDYNITIPYINMIQIIALITVPLFIGIFIKYKFIKIAVTILKLLKPVTVICILVFLTVGLYSNWYIFKLFRPLHILAGCLLPYLGYIIGGAIAAILKQPFARVKTIALETGMQNVGVAYLLMISSFPPPHGDLSSVAPMASALMTPFPPFLVTIVYLIYKKCFKKYEPVLEDEPEVKVNANGDQQVLEQLSSV
ncbi:ileal sodium/bile acid cotransporter-like [Mercenaria mercenaria]|uniref:ileal sodium/bile acid cotransporter-like n=1 Tax=Mercenaria mercenaria TaxID=6596 RepID=UPI00234F66BA|nr:ileal sodium/bile acid cotransporter-like [Mercenaria mercenaria]